MLCLDPSNGSKRESKPMNELRKFMCCAAIAVVAGIASTSVLAQTGGRALLIYKEGVTPEQEEKDRAACNEWAIQQSGFDPSAIYTAQQAGIRTRTIFEVVGKLDVAAAGTDPRWGSGAFGGASTSADKKRLALLYDNYLRAGALCLEGRGYAVTR
jgi:hypothetical protein